jgi:hypothetical protein
MSNRHDERHSRTFECRGLTTVVEASDGGILDWLEEFLLPAFAVVPAGRAGRRVTVSIDPLRYERLEASRRVAPGRAVDCFTLHGRFASFPLWRESERWRLILDDRNRVFYLIEAGARRVHLVAQGGSRCLHPAGRVIRELAAVDAQSRGELQLHAAAFLHHDRGALIVGPKGAGKTSLLTHCLAGTGARYIANDRVFVGFSGSRAMVHGGPALVHVKAESRGVVPAADAFPWSEGGGVPLKLNARRYCELLGADVAREGELATILFSEVSPQGAGVVLRPLSRQRAARLLQRNLMGGTPFQRPAEAFAPGHRMALDDEAAVLAACVRIVSRTRCVSCTLGRGAFRNGSALDDLLELAASRRRGSGSARP